MTRKHWLVLCGVLIACSEERFAVHSERTSPDRLAAVSGNAGQSEKKEQKADPRKVIRNVTVAMRVASVTTFIHEMEKIASSADGYVSNLQTSNDDNGPRAGTLTARVSADKIDAVRESLRGLGKMESEQLKAEDITDQYYDLTARLNNARALEDRLKQLLADRPGKLSDVVDLETKLSQVRETIEQLQGNQRRWDSQVVLATLTISFHTDPPAVVETGLVAQMRHAFGGSVTALIGLGRGVLVFAAALLPWLPLFLLAGGLIRWRIRRA